MPGRHCYAEGNLEVLYTLADERETSADGDIGDYLTERGGISIVGTHDLHNTAEWHDATIVWYFYSLMTSGRFSLEGLTLMSSHPTNAPIFDWANILKK